MEQRGSFAPCPAQVPDTITQTTIIIKGIMDSTLKENDAAAVCNETNPSTKNIGKAQSTQKS